MDSLVRSSYANDAATALALAGNSPAAASGTSAAPANAAPARGGGAPIAKHGE